MSANGKGGIHVPKWIYEGLMDDYITTTVRVYGYLALLAPPRERKPLTRKQKRRIRRQERMRQVGRRLYDLANKFGYFHDCEVD